MPGISNRGKARILEMAFRGQFAGGAYPTNFYVPLFTSTTTPTPDINVMTDMTQIAIGNGYADGGVAKARGTVDIKAVVEDDVNDIAYVQTTDVVYTAAGGPIPASGLGARYAGLTDDNATVGSREIFGWWDLVSDRTVSDGQTLTLQNPEFRLTE